MLKPQSLLKMTIIEKRFKDPKTNLLALAVRIVARNIFEFQENIH